MNAINEIDSQRWLEASPIREEIYNQEKARMSDDIKNDAFSNHSINDPRETIYSNSVNFIFKATISLCFIKTHLLAFMINLTTE